MGLLMLVHVQFASFLIGVITLGVALEFIWVVTRRNEWFDRLAYSIARVSVYIYSFGAVLAIAFVLLTALFWPVFWVELVRVTFWPFALEAVTFVIEIVFLFPWYYTWRSMRRHQAAHLSLGLALVVAAQWQQAFIDIVAGYMMTPVPPEDVVRLFLNPTATPLNMHRFAGDLSLAGFFVATAGGVLFLRARTAEDRRYYDWVGHIGLITGLGFLFIQPAIGLSYAEEIRANAAGAFSMMMRGSLSWVFLVQIAILSLLFFLGIYYMWLQVRKSRLPGQRTIFWTLVIAGFSGLLAIQPYVIGPSQDSAWIPWVNPLGAMQPWKYIALAGLSLSGIIAVLAYLSASRRGLAWGEVERGGRRAQKVLVVLGVSVSLMMIVMGYIREAGRLPYLIYSQPGFTIEQQQQYPELPPPRAEQSNIGGQR